MFDENGVDFDERGFGFDDICPNCQGKMANGNKFCSLRCYDEFDDKNEEQI